MSKVVDTKYGKVAFVDSDAYFNGDLMHGSMGSISKEAGAKYVLLLGDKVKAEDIGVEKAEELVEMVMNATKRPYKVIDDGRSN